MKRYPQRSVLRPRRTLLAWSALLVVAGLCIAVAPQIRINPTFKSMILSNDPDRSFDRETKEIFGDDELLLVAIDDPKGVFNRETLALVDQITRQVVELESVRDVYSLTNIDNIRDADGLLDTNDLIEELPQTDEELEAVRAAAYENPIYGSWILSKDGTVASVNIEPHIEHSSTEARAALTEKVLEIVDTADVPEGVSVHVTGFPVSSYFGASFMIRDMVVFGGLACVLLMLIMWLVFRNVQGIVFTMFVTMAGVATTYGVMSLMGVPVTMPLSSVMVFVAALGMEYSIYVGYAYIHAVQSERANGRPIRDHRFVVSEAMRSVRGPVILSTLTTAAGFLSMLTNSVPDLAKMGLYLAIGTAAVGLASLTIVPALLSLWPFEVKPPRQQNRVALALTRWSGRSASRRPWHHLAIISGLLALGAIGLARLDTDTDAMQYFKESSEIRQDEEFVRARMAGTTYLQAVVVAEGIDAFKEPENLARLADVQAYAETLPHVTKTVSHADHIKLLNRALRGGSEEEYRLPDTRAAVEQYLLLHNEPDDFRQVIDHDYQRANIMVRLDTMSSTVLREVERDLEAFMATAFPDAEVNLVGTTLLVHRAFDEMATSMLKGLALACALIWVLMVIAFGSLKLGTLALLPNAAPILVNYSIIAWIGHSLDPPIAVTGAIAMGIAVDDTVHFFKTWQRISRQAGIDAQEAVIRTVDEVGRPMVLSSLVLAASFGILTFSQYGTLVWMGIMLAITATNALIFDLVFTPALLRLVKVRHPTPTPAELEALQPLNKTKVTEDRQSLDDYTDEELHLMMTYDFFALAGKTVIRQGGNFGTRRLLYELDIQPGTRILEVGAGVGATAFQLALLYDDLEIVGTDLSPYMIERARKRAEELGIADRCTFVVSPGDGLPFEDESFDIVLTESVLMYTDAKSILAEVQRVLVPGGKLGFHDWSWSREPPEEVEQLACVVACGCNVSDVRFYGERGWDDVIEAGGFELEYSREFPFAFFSLDSMRDDEGTWNLIKMFARVCKRRASFRRMIRVMRFLARYEGTFGYVIAVGRKPGGGPTPS